MASAGLGVTRSPTVAAVTPINPTAAAGIGSRIKAMITATNSAK